MWWFSFTPAFFLFWAVSKSQFIFESFIASKLVFMIHACSCFKYTFVLTADEVINWEAHFFIEDPNTEHIGFLPVSSIWIDGLRYQIRTNFRIKLFNSILKEFFGNLCFRCWPLLCQCRSCLNAGYVLYSMKSPFKYYWSWV